MFQFAKAKVTAEGLVEELNAYRGGDRSTEQFFAEIDQILADGHLSAEELLSTLVDHSEQSPLPPQLLSTIRRHIELVKHSGPRSGAIKAGSADPRKDVGQVLSNRFELLEQIDTIGMSVVYRAFDRDSARNVTVELLKRKFHADDESLSVLRNEAVKAQRLEHPNIVQLFGFFFDGDTAYLVMEHLSGEFLSHRIGSGSQGVMPRDKAIRIVNDVGKVLTLAHGRGMVHSALNPTNVFLTDDGQVKVFDFGIAYALYRTAARNRQQTQPGKFGGLTQSYASPEILEVREPDRRDDVFALACMAYEMLTGEHPFQHMRARSARDAGLKVEPRPELDSPRWQALQSALRFERERRTASVEAFLTAFNAAERGRGRRTALIAVVASLATIALGAAVISYFLRSSFPPERQLADASQPADQPVSSTATLVDQPGQVTTQAAVEVKQALTDPADLPSAVAAVDRLQAVESELRAAQQEQQRLLEELKGERRQVDETRAALQQADRKLQKSEQMLARATDEQNGAEKRLVKTQVQLERSEQAVAKTARALEHSQAAAANAETLVEGQQSSARRERALQDSLQKRVQSLQAEVERQRQLAESLESKNQQQRADLMAQLERWALKARKSEQSLSTSGQEIVALQNRMADLQLRQDSSVREWAAKLEDALQQSTRLESELSALRKAKPNPAESAPSVISPQSKQLLAELLVRADRQFAKDRLTLPEGDNASETYRQMLLLDPRHPDALKGLGEIKRQYQQWAAKARKAGRLQRARGHLEKALSVAPGDRELTKALGTINQRIEQSRAAKGAAASAPIPPPTPAPEATTERVRQPQAAPEVEQVPDRRKEKIRSFGSFL